MPASEFAVPHCARAPSAALVERHCTPPRFTSFIFSSLGKGHPFTALLSRLCFLFAFSRFPQTTSPWQTRRRNPKARSQAGNILSTIRRRGNSWGALQAVGVRKDLLRMLRIVAVSLYTTTLMTLIDQMARRIVAQYPLTPCAFFHNELKTVNGRPYLKIFY